MIEVMYVSFSGTVCNRCSQHSPLLFAVGEQWVCFDCLLELIETDKTIAEKVIDAFDFPVTDEKSPIPEHLKVLSIQ